MITVFYDGACGLCAREIKHYKSISPPNLFHWVDITVTPDPFTKLGFKVSDGLKLLHVQDEHGKLYIGADAFIQLWRPLKRWRILAFLASIPGIKQLLRVVYKKFAGWRFKKLGYTDE